MQLTIVVTGFIAALRALAAPIADDVSTALTAPFGVEISNATSLETPFSAPDSDVSNISNFPPIEFGPITVIYLFEHKDFGGTFMFVTLSGAAVYPCSQVPKHLYAKGSSYIVTDGDCDFFGGDNCSNFLFRAVNRADKKLKKGHNDRIRSFLCRTLYTGKGV